MPEQYQGMSDHDLLVTIATRLEEIQQKQGDHENRLRIAETFRNKIVGIVVIIPTVIAIVGILISIYVNAKGVIH